MGIRFGDGIVTYDPIGLLTRSGQVSIEDVMLEDLIQIQYPKDDVFLDVGWYPEGDEKGCFRIYLVKAGDWNCPLAIKKTKSIDGLKRQIEFLVKELELGHWSSNSDSHSG